MTRQELDFLLTVRALSPDGIFPRVNFCGFGEKTFCFVPYSDKNLRFASGGLSSIEEVNNYFDDKTKDAAFAFAQGFNSYGFALGLINIEKAVKEKAEKVGVTNYLNDKFFRQAYKKEEKVATDSVTSPIVLTSLSTLPAVFAFDAGALLARAALREEANHHDTADASGSFSSDKLETYSSSADFYRTCGARKINEIFEPSPSAPAPIVSTAEVMEIFRKNLKEEDYTFFLPLFEHVAQSIHTRDSADFFLKFFVVINHFLDSNTDAYFSDFFDEESQREAVEHQYATWSIPRHKHTRALMEAMTAPGRIFALPIIRNSAVRRLCAESTAETMRAIVSLTRSVTTPRRAISMIEDCTLAQRLDIPFSEELDALISHRGVEEGARNDTNAKFFGFFLDSSDCTESERAAVEGLVPATSAIYQQAVKDFIVKDRDGAIRVKDVAVLLYALHNPFSANVKTSASMYLLARYCYEKYGSLEQFSEIMTTLMADFDNFLLTPAQWKMVVDFYDSSRPARHTVSIALTGREKIVERGMSEKTKNIVTLYRDN